MGREIYPAMTGGARALKALDVLSNNLANVNTTGFKADRAAFTLHQPDAAEGTGESERRLAGAWASLDGMHTDFSQGSLQETGNASHLALTGHGFFQLQAPDAPGGLELTRDGAFEVNAAGVLVARSGQAVLSDKGEPLEVGHKGFQIDAQGVVKVEGQERGRVAVADVTEIERLQKVAGNRFQMVEGQKSTVVGGSVQQFHLEGSNVSPVDSLTQMIALSRYYESFQKSLETSSELDQQLNTVGRIDR
jgi:flagellar basal-body rod protein FlgF